MMSDNEEGIQEFQPVSGMVQSQDFHPNPSISIPESQVVKAGISDIPTDTSKPESVDTDLVLSESDGGSKSESDPIVISDIPMGTPKPGSQDTDLVLSGSGSKSESNGPYTENEDDWQTPHNLDLDQNEKPPKMELRDGFEDRKSEEATSEDLLKGQQDIVESVKENGKSKLNEESAKAKKARKLEAYGNRIKQMKASTMYTDFKCAVCEKSLSDPCYLDCLHAFCAGCLTVEEEQKIKCPTCLTETGLPEGGLDALPRIRILEDFAEKNSGTKHCEVCKLMKKVNGATGFCVECKDYLCQNCWDVHKFTKFTLNHEVISLEGTSIEELEKQSKGQEEHSKCSKHSSEDLRYFCKGCEEYVCTDCILLDHQNHPCISIQEAFERQMVTFDMLLKGVDEKIQRIEMEEFEPERNVVELAEEIQVEKIKSTIEMVIQGLRQQEAEAIASVHQKFQNLKQHSQKRQYSAQEILFHLKEVKTICGCLSALSNNEEFLALEKKFLKRLLIVLNMTIMPEPLSWFSTPEVEVESWLIDNKKLKSLFRITNHSKCHDWVEDMPCIGSLKEFYQDREASKKAGHPEWYKGNIQKTMEYNHKVDEDQHIFNRNADLDPVRSISTQSESGSTANSENYEEEGARPKTIGPKKRRGRKKKNAASSIENITQHHLMADEGSCEVQESNFYDASLYGQVPGYVGMSEYLNHSLFRPLQFPEEGFYPGSHYMMNSVSLNSLTNISKTGKVPIKKSQQQSNQPAKPQSKTSKEKNKMKEKPAAESTSKQKTAKAAKVKPVNASVSITPKWRLDTKCSDDKDPPFLTSVHPIQHNKVVVSDSVNNKIKIFSIEGTFIKAYNVENPTSVIFVCGVLIWTSGPNVVIQEMNDEFVKVINFQNASIPRPLSWYPQSQFAVANGDHLRIYHVDKEKSNFTKKSQVSFELPNQQKMSNIFSVRSNGNGKSIVMTDWDLKAVVIGDNEGKVTGMYTGDKGTSWYPGGACFNNIGDVFTLDYTNNRLLLLSTDGEMIQEWNTAPTITQPWSVICGSARQLFITGSDHYVHVYQYMYDEQ